MASNEKKETKSSHPRFAKDDLVIVMPRVLKWDELSDTEKFTAKYHFLKETYGAQNFFLAGCRGTRDEASQTWQIRISNIYATFEFETSWPGLDSNRRRTTKSLADLLAKTKATKGEGGDIPRNEDDGATGNNMRHAKGFARSRLEDTGDDAISQHQKQQKTYHQSHATSELGNGSSFQTDRTAIQSFSSLTSSKGRIRSNGSGTYGSSTAVAQASSEIVNTVKHQAHRPNGELSIQRRRGADSLVREGVSVNKQHINQATTASRPRLEFDAQDQTVNNLQPGASNPQQGSRPSYLYGVTLHNFLGEVVPQSWSGRWIGIHQKDVKVEVNAQFVLILEVLATSPFWAAESLDTQKTEAKRRLKSDFVESEKQWMTSHPQVTVSEDTNKFTLIALVNRHLACLTIDVGLERGKVSGLSAPERKRHFIDVQFAAMSRQLVRLRSWTHVRKSFATRKQCQPSSPSSQSIEESVQDVADQTGKKDANSTVPSEPALPERVALPGEGFSQPAAQIRALVVDEDTGLASVESVGDLPKQPEPRATAGQPEKVLKRKRDAEPSTRRKKPKTSCTDEDTSRIASPQLAEPFDSQARQNSHIGASRTTAGGVDWQSEPSFIDLEASFGTDEIRPPADGTIDPAKLTKSYPIVSGQDSIPKSQRNASASTVRIFKDVPREATEAVYGIVSEEERTRELARHRQETAELMGADPSRSEEVHSFLYVTPGMFDNFGYDDELDVTEDEAEDRVLDSQGLWKW